VTSAIDHKRRSVSTARVRRSGSAHAISSGVLPWYRLAFASITLAAAVSPVWPNLVNSNRNSDSFDGIDPQETSDVDTALGAVPEFDRN
jgi:hypothetical protein